MPDKSSRGGSLALAIWNGPGVVIAREGLTTEEMRDELVRQARAHGAQIVAVDALLSDESTETISRRLNPQAWEVIADMRPATREEYAEALRSEARRALSVASTGEES